MPSDSIASKLQIEEILIQAYKMVWELRQLSMKGELTESIVNATESFFTSNEVNLNVLHIQNPYLYKYAKQISLFFQAYESYLGRMRSKGKFNLFNSLRDNDLRFKGYSDVECAKILRLMEAHWIASNQVFTNYQVQEVRRSFTI